MPEPSLQNILTHQRWWRGTRPFPYLWANSVFQPAFYRELEAAFQALFALGLSDIPSADRLSKNMKYSDAYSWNFPPDIVGPLSIFYSRAWHDLLDTLVGTTSTSDVNGAIHHHQVGSSNGSVHRDLAVGWFTRQPRPDGINPMDLNRCSYISGQVSSPDVVPYERVRAVTMIFYLGNPEWLAGDGGETGLYSLRDTPVEHPAVRLPPRNNSLLIFENTPDSYHSFIRNTRSVRNSVILWTHRGKNEADARWGSSRVSRF